MASSGERRLVFDTRGKRKHVVRVVYAILALLMGGSLFLVIGPVNIGEIIGNSNTSGSSASEVFDEQAERIEARLVKSPNDEQMLLALTRARINAGNAQLERPSETETPTVTPEAQQDFQAAAAAWQSYLKQAGDEPSATGAQLVAGTFFQLAESGSTSLGEIEENVALAASAQRIVAKQRPSLGSFSSLAIYEYFDGNTAAGDKATKEAAAKATAKAEAKGIEEQLAEYRKRAEQFQTSLKKAAKVEQQAGAEALKNPFEGLTGTTGGE